MILERSFKSAFQSVSILQVDFLFDGRNCWLKWSVMISKFTSIIFSHVLLLHVDWCNQLSFSKYCMNPSSSESWCLRRRKLEESRLAQSLPSPHAMQGKRTVRTLPSPAAWQMHIYDLHFSINLCNPNLHVQAESRHGSSSRAFFHIWYLLSHDGVWALAEHYLMN